MPATPAPTAEPPTPEPPAAEPPAKKSGLRGLFGRKRHEAGQAGPSEHDERSTAATSSRSSAGTAALAGALSADAPVAGARAADEPVADTAENTVIDDTAETAAVVGATDGEAPATDTAAADAQKGAAEAGGADDATTSWGVPSGRGSTAHRAPEAPAGQDDQAETAATAAAGGATAGTAGPGTAGTGTAGPGASDDTGRADGAGESDGVFGATSTAAAAGAGLSGMAAAAVAGATGTDHPKALRTDDDPEQLATADGTDGLGQQATQPDGSQYQDFEYTPGGADTERSSASQWLILIAQVLGAAVAGAALFIGFQLLWRDLPWIAFALAVVVIIGLVAMVRVLRRANDTVSISLAVIVGLGVTCGPLLLRVIT